MLQINTILHPTDFSERSQPALDVARAMARDHGARLVVVHVAPLGVTADGGLVVPVDPAYYRAELEEMCKKLEGPDLKQPVEARLRQGDAASETLQEAEDRGCSLIVMGSHGRTGLARLLMGSVAEAVMRRARCPVLVVKTPLASTPASVQTSRPVAAEQRTE